MSKEFDDDEIIHAYTVDDMFDDGLLKDFPFVSKGKFKLGRIVMTLGIDELITENHKPESYYHYLLYCLKLHLIGDWGVVCDSDKNLNDQALKHDLRLFSAYMINPLDKPSQTGKVFYIITERDRSVTTLLLPSEY